MEEALNSITLNREFAHLDAGITRLPDESSILRFWHTLEAHSLWQQILAAGNAKPMDRGLMLKSGTVMDATLISALNSIKDDQGEQDARDAPYQKGQSMALSHESAH